jgi:flagellar hook-length control protein FliK
MVSPANPAEAFMPPTQPSSAAFSGFSIWRAACTLFPAMSQPAVAIVKSQLSTAAAAVAAIPPGPAPAALHAAVADKPEVQTAFQAVLKSLLTTAPKRAGNANVPNSAAAARTVASLPAKPAASAPASIQTALTARKPAPKLQGSAAAPAVSATKPPAPAVPQLPDVALTQTDTVAARNGKTKTTQAPAAPVQMLGAAPATAPSVPVTAEAVPAATAATPLSASAPAGSVSAVAAHPVKARANQTTPSVNKLMAASNGATPLTRGDEAPVRTAGESAQAVAALMPSSEAAQARPNTGADATTTQNPAQHSASAVAAAAPAAAAVALAQGPSAQAPAPREAAAAAPAPLARVRTAPLPTPQAPASIVAPAGGTAAAAPAPIAASAAHQATLAAPTAQIAHAVAVHIAPGASGNVTIQLQPAELGAVQVRIERAHDGSATVTVQVEKNDTLHVLQQDMPRLHQALDRAGLPAESRQVTLHLAPSAGSDTQTSLGNSDGQRQGGAARQPHRTAATAGTDTPDDDAPPVWRPAGINITA